MTDRLQYSIASAINPTTAEHRFVVVGSDEVLHQEASQWLDFLLALGRSPNTAREYGRRVVDLPPNRGGMHYEEWSCQRHGGSSIRSSGRERCGSSGRAASRSPRWPGTWVSTRARSATGSPTA